MSSKLVILCKGQDVIRVGSGAFWSFYCLHRHLFLHCALLFYSYVFDMGSSDIMNCIFPYFFYYASLPHQLQVQVNKKNVTQTTKKVEFKTLTKLEYSIENLKQANFVKVRATQICIIKRGCQNQCIPLLSFLVCKQTTNDDVYGALSFCMFLYIAYTTKLS